MLLSWANTWFYQEVMAAMRAAIAEGRFAAWAAETRARLEVGSGEKARS
jgi:queuine tRNA-ribosyltransferase